MVFLLCPVSPYTKNCSQNLYKVFLKGVKPRWAKTYTRPMGCCHYGTHAQPYYLCSMAATDTCFSLFRPDQHVLGYVYTIPDSLCADTKTISDRASVHKGITNFGAVFTTERRCAASILKVNRHVSDRYSYHSLASCEQVPDRSGSQ